jgi:hypothetical protein
LINLANNGLHSTPKLAFTVIDQTETSTVLSTDNIALADHYGCDRDSDRLRTFYRRGRAASHGERAGRFFCLTGLATVP